MPARRTRGTRTGAALTTMAALACLGMGPDPSWELRYGAPSECPPEPVFREAVAQRLGHRSEEGRAAHRRSVQVVLRPAEREWTGTLSVSTADGAVVERQASASNCKELVAALSLMTAVALDLEVASSPESPPGPTGPMSSASTSATATVVPIPPKATVPPAPAVDRPSSAAPAVDRPSSAAPAVDRPSSAAPAVDRPSTAAPSVDRPSSGSRSVDRPSPPHRWFAAVEGFVRGRSLFTPSPSGAPALALGVRHGGFAPWVRLSAERATSRVQGDGPGATVHLWLTEVDACSHQWSLGGRVRLSPCLHVEVGAFEAIGRQVNNARRGTDLWLSTGVLAELSVRLVGPVLLRAQSGVSIPLIRDRIYAGPPDRTLAIVPNAVWLGGAGVAVEVW